MQAITATYLILLSLVVALIMMRDHVKGRVELLSIRNFTLLGFIVFQLTSGAVILYRDYDPKYPLTDSGRTGVAFAFSCTVFLIILLAMYRWGPVVRKAARALPTTRVVPSEPFMWLCAVTLMMMALFLRAFVAVPLIAALADYLGTAFASIACGLAGWTWAKRFLNPAAMVYAMVIFLGSAAAVMVGSFGRRGLVAVGAGLIWGMYYSRLRYADGKRVIVQALLAAAIPAILLAMYTSARSSTEHERGVAEHIKAMATKGDVGMGFMLLLDGQGTAGVSMWLMEQCPESYPYRWFHTPKYALLFPVPRRLWPDKPEPLSSQIAEMANRQGVNRSGLTVGPGIIGHAAHEGGFIALIVYAILGGLFLRFYDEIIAKCPTSPFVVLPVGASMGQIVGLARGETAAFIFAYVFGVLGSYFALLMVARFVERTGLAGATQGDAPADGELYEHEYDGAWDDAEQAEAWDEESDEHRHAG